jgi:hypothetical protein
MRYLFFILLLLLLLSGCRNNNPQGRVPVRGEVTFDGKPLEQGEILFSSIVGTTPTVTTGSSIKNGKFSLSAEHGLIPEQTYSVQFRSVEIISDTQNETKKPIGLIYDTNNIKITSKDLLGFETRNIIPRKYGIDSKETVTTTKKIPNMFQFDLTSDHGK